MTTAPYDEAAEIYLAGGLWTIPVIGKDQPVAGATGYEGTVTPEKIMRWLHPDPVVRARAGRGVRMDNVAVRHDLTVAIDVDDGYGDKNGVQQLVAFAKKHDLPPLPGTWSSTARGFESPSRQFIYAIAENVKMKTKPCKAVEVCCWHHRYTVASPSIHPNNRRPYTWYLPGAPGVPPTWGAATTRYPRREFFTPLPSEWFRIFQGGLVNADRSAVTVALPGLVATFAPGEPDGLIRYLLAKWESEHVGHDEFKNAMIHALMLGRQGHTGVAALVELLIERFTDYVNDARPNTAGREVESLVEFCTTIAQQKPLPPAPKPGEPLTPEQFMADMVAPTTSSVDNADSADPIGLAAAEELAYLFGTYTRCVAPERLDLRVTWAMGDPVHRLPVHAQRLIEDALLGLYPAAPAYHGLVAACRVHGISEADARTVFAVALGKVLDARMAAAQ